MASEVFNQGGSSARTNNDSSGAMRSDSSSAYSPADRASDEANAAAARQHAGLGDYSGAQESIKSIKDPALRFTLYKEIWGGKANMAPPRSLFKDGSGGLEDPLALFFMMIFYLDKQTTQFEWSQVLQAATEKGGNNKFGNLNPDTGFITQTPDTPKPPIIAAREKIQQDVQNRQTSIQNDVNKQRDAVKEKMGASGGGSASTAYTTVWPIQNMPLIQGGISKGVDWDSSKVKATTFAEPIITVNGGAEAIEFDLEFTYAVGIAGVKGSQAASKEKGGAGFDPQNEDYWTVEEVMGMIYLACSLVYPFESAKIVGSEDEAKQTVNKSPQFPVLFMRHYSLFPFLTPFVVKSVKVEPDENQPLIITEPFRLGTVESHMRFPAVRQVVKITLSLMSAHYYVSMFKETSGNEIQKQTSGKTFLTLAKGLLSEKLV